MPTAWDRRPPKTSRAAQDAALRTQVVDLVGPFSPWWRDRLKALGRTAADASTRDGLRRLPAAGERDVCADGDPAGAAALVLQAGEQGWSLHAEGPRLRAAMARRLLRPGSYARVVEEDTRPTSYVWAGLSLRFPVASTRRDLDVVARAGARAWQVLGLSRADVVVSALPTRRTAAVQALELGALGASAPLLAPGPVAEDVAAALRLVPATVLAVGAARAARLVDDLDEAGAPLGTLTTLLLVGSPDPEEREDARAALDRAGVPGCTVLALHVPDGHRLAWAECRESSGSTGLHTSPDLELLELVDPDTAGTADGPGEVVLTQLGLRGSALLRWRTGDLADELTEAACPACGRTVPRVVGLRRTALVPELMLRSGVRSVDLRAVAGALLARGDVRDWRVELARSRRDDADELLVHVVPAAGEDEADVVVGVARDVRGACGVLPTQVVLAAPGALPADGEPLTGRVLLRG